MYVILTLLFFSFFFKSLLSNGERRRMLRILKVEWGGRSDGLIARIFAVIIYREKSCVIQIVGRN